eukprot:TRINITY_DN5337_c0_g2_i2.p1 TRINITY_DN5337_c0_g2~~TRINITY_DN5337_c0_g2_i2.p1  ORF type:complete len:233 (+),score=53.10 TRINITY_DN5337_c0_g2_i2:86-784(+)
MRRVARRAMSSAGAGDALRVDYTAGGAVAVVTLSRPARMNALSFAMGERLLGLPRELAPQTRAVVVTGDGKAFSTGRDLKDSKGHTEADAARYMAIARDTVKCLHAFPIPTVAAVNGHAFGWGLELALACDLRVVVQDATLCFPETAMGIFPGALGAVLLPRLVGPAVASDLIVTARRFDGFEAHRLGLANRLTADPDACAAEAVALAAAIARNAPLGVAGAREVMREGLDR